MKINRFEELECWQEARILTKKTYDYTKYVDFLKDFRLSGQITGAAISTMNNICEGFDSRSNKEFIRFLTYSRRSCSEVQNCSILLWTRSTSPQKNFKAPMNIVRKSGK